MTKFRDGLLGPSVILLTICLITTIALAFTYRTTKPIIDRAALDAVNDALAEVLPGGANFVKIEDAELPEGVLEAYESDSGYVFKSQAKGYGGEVTYMIGINGNGEIVGIKMFEHDETPGLGTKVAEPEYLEKYYGATNPNRVDAVTGATRTSNSLKNSLNQALEAYRLIKG